MAFLSQVAAKVTVATTYSTAQPIPIVHPSYTFNAQLVSVNKQGVQKQAAENFNWGH